MSYLLLALVAFAVGFFVRGYVTLIKDARPTDSEDSEESAIAFNLDEYIKPDIDDKHMKPSSIFYSEGTYANTNKCEECSLTGFDSDLHSVYPCPKCGGSVVRNGAARWEEKDGINQWVPPSKNEKTTS